MSNKAKELLQALNDKLKEVEDLRAQLADELLNDGGDVTTQGGGVPNPPPNPPGGGG